jgi:ubiquinone/menaquinone biosynthesis C-methylase UbiE
MLHACRFARSGAFSGVVAADFSENMLRQAKAFFTVSGLDDFSQSAA